MKTIPSLSLLLIGTLLLAGCGGGATQPTTGLQVVASTTIVGDVVAQVGGAAIDLTVLYPAGADPHTYEPTPRDLAAISKADVVFLNGAGLEESLISLLEANAPGAIVALSDGIDLLTFEGETGEEPDEHLAGDPHTWMDPNNVILWVEAIAETLSALDPAHAGTYQENAAAYSASLQELDAWILEQVRQVPLENRKIVTDHLIFGYFGEAYGFIQAGALIEAFSTNAEPSAQDLASLEDLILREGIAVIFVGESINPALAEQVARETGIVVVHLYSGSLSEPGGEADSYLAYMRYNVEQIVAALK